MYKRFSIADCKKAINNSENSNGKTIPLVISTGVNRLFGLPSSPEITCIHIHPKEKSLGMIK